MMPLVKTIVLISKKAVFVVFAVFCVGFLNSLSAQTVDSEGFYLNDDPLPDDVPYFDVEMINSIADSQGVSRLTVKLIFVNNELQFVKAGKKKFRADFEVAETFLDSSDKEVKSLQWHGSVYAKKYKNTESTKIKHTTQTSIDLPPGTYKFSIILKDIETGRSGKRKGGVTVRNFDTGKVMVSDPSLNEIDQGTTDNNDVMTVNQKDYWVRYDVYNVPEQDTLKMHYEVSIGDSVIQNGDRFLISQGRITPDSLQLEHYSGLLTDLHLKLNLKYLNQSYDIEKTISCDCPSRKLNFTNIKEAVEQLVYIAKKNELKKLKSLTGQAQIKAFYDFWKKKDPTPDTPENEYMVEYYHRVDFASKKFGRDNDGWKSEMGMVYIMLGPPDYIDRPSSYNNYYDPTLSRRPNLIWQYINLRRRVIFIYRAGEYRIENYSEIFDLLTGDMIF